MKLPWYQRNQEAVVAALKRGERPDMATTMASGPLDELVALHDALGVFSALDDLPTSRLRGGLDDALLLRTAATLPFLERASLSGAAGQLFGDPAILLLLSWSPLQIQMGDNERHRCRAGRRPESLPCSPESLRDALARVEQSAWQRVQESGAGALFEHNLVHGRSYAIDGTGLGKDLRLVCLVCVSARRPVIVAWRLLSGAASEKGKEASVTRSLIEQALRAGGPQAIGLLLVDALYADGPLLAWCKYARGIDVLVPVPGDREIHRDLEGLANGGLLKFERFSYVRTIQGHKRRRTLQAAAQAGRTRWDSFIEAAGQYGAQEPALWGCLIRPVDPTDADDKPWTLASTRCWPTAEAGFQAYRFHLQLKLTPGGLVQMWRRLGELLDGWYEQIHREALQSAVLHGDETGWRTEGKTHWLWCFGNQELTYSLIDRSRGSPALTKFFVQEFADRAGHRLLGRVQRPLVRGAANVPGPSAARVGADREIQVARRRVARVRQEVAAAGRRCDSAVAAASGVARRNVRFAPRPPAPAPGGVGRRAVGRRPRQAARQTPAATSKRRVHVPRSTGSPLR